MSHPAATTHGHARSKKKPEEGTTRRDFIVLAATALGGVGAAATAWPFISSMNPSADVLALSQVEVDLTPIQVGQGIKVKWRGSPVFVRHRTPVEIQAAQNDDHAALPDPATDESRVKKGHEQWLIVIDVCTHLGCIPIAYEGDYHGWFCPCHGSQYDTSGRIRRGPAPKNLIVPDYTFLSDTRIRIG